MRPRKFFVGQANTIETEFESISEILMEGQVPNMNMTLTTFDQTSPQMLACLMTQKENSSVSVIFSVK
ncbi:hypothetical protein A2348_05240 [Candidatus Uhrbacteria bacterium RIFOXYB12_FULL_58_10]|uniref:Uncharacterized protein n=1 Tax=Candidatus Uhrbacteria bacterium RIFOXYB2_FULL_57_15 TaxID=1802422 RepID=A0A1F7W503_9BACT|nr:MAG: hypothetical protein A2348_05240 [Candidatus Uhrbacteria bacterium RIFOXYB12_FULL_58_10]OGL97716.1 MAG: hypothetical protein A2304_00430 [Candidatus Uhrbacteria bacterium RIFOXYB2_FULL_57_15]OGM00029.1 MAG: hypothetical protein A2501_03705 [Candidatus Uhrbacteria bacterium RIFOXYC12_FULL_57_11]